MSYAKILVPLTGEIGDLVALRTAIAAARPFNAHVAALFVYLDPQYALAYTRMQLSPNVIEDVLRDSEEIARHAEARVRDVLSAVLGEEDISLVDPPQRRDAVTCSFKSVKGLFHDVVLKAADLSDLVVFGPFDGRHEPEIWQSFYDSLLKAHRPLLMTNDVPERLTGKIVIAWDDSSVAAHAVSAALPFLKSAKDVEIVTVYRPSQMIDINGLREFLSLHGVMAGRCDVAISKGQVSESIIRAAKAANADLLVMGSYSHGYWREALFGGVTEDIRQHGNVPLFMLH